MGTNMASRYFYFLIFFFSLNSVAMHYKMPRQTKNNMGINFDSLGEFEEKLLQNCQHLIDKNPQSIPKILFLGSAYGRLPLRFINDIKGKAEFFVNELSLDNLTELIEQINQLSKNSNNKNINHVSTFIGDCLLLNHNHDFIKKSGPILYNI